MINKTTDEMIEYLGDDFDSLIKSTAFIVTLDMNGKLKNFREKTYKEALEKAVYYKYETNNNNKTME